MWLIRIERRQRPLLTNTRKGTQWAGLLLQCRAVLVGRPPQKYIDKSERSQVSSTISQRPGTLRAATLRGAPVFIHWSFPLGGLVISAFGGFRPLQILYCILAYSTLIAIHELGHLVAAWSLGLKVFAVDISGIGGVCRIQQPRNIRERAIVYSAGLIAQLILLLATLLFFRFHDPSHSDLANCVAFTFVPVNGLIFALNLIPAKSRSGFANDGMILWQLLRHVFIGSPLQPANPVDVSPVYSSRKSLLSIPDLVPPGFATGVEIFNDNTTPMDFVVETLTRHLDLDQADALRLMSKIHAKGGALVSLADMQKAEAVAFAVMSHARERGYKFLCRAVDIRS